MKKTPKIKILKIEKFADAKNSGVFVFGVDDFLREGMGKVDPMQSIHSHTLRQP